MSPIWQYLWGRETGGLKNSCYLAFLPDADRVAEISFIAVKFNTVSNFLFLYYLQ